MNKQIPNRSKLQIQNSLNRICSLLLLIFSLTGCQEIFPNSKHSSGPVLSLLFNNRILLLLKATYASDNPLSFSDYSGGTGSLYLDSQGTNGDPDFDLAGLPSAADLPIFIDIGEVRISSKKDYPNGLQQIKNSKDSQKFWDFIAPNRQVYCTTLYSGTNTCSKDQGYLKIQQMFDGTGAEFPATDPSSTFFGFDPAGHLLTSQYYYTGVFFRSLVTGFAKMQGGGVTTQFDNNTISGENIIPVTSYAPGTDAALQQTENPDFFPLLYQLVGGQSTTDMSVRPGFDSYIMEVRFNMKENLMVHSYINPTTNSTETLVAFSDWRYNHTGQADMGGDVLLRSRIIYPETASQIYIHGGTHTHSNYYAIYRDTETDFQNQLPLAASGVQDGVSMIKFLQAGTYILQCRDDSSPVDGYPETIVRDTTFSVQDFPNNGRVDVNLTCP